MANQPTRESITFRSAIKPELMHLALKKGGGVAVAGALIILLSGMLLPLAYLKIWGIPLFFAGLLLIAIGWLPYRQLQRLQIKPHELQCDGEHLLFVKDGKPLLKIPEKSIAEIKYVENTPFYGMGILLKKPIVEQVKILQRRLNFEVSRFGCDIYLPYFTQRSVDELKDLLESDHAS